MSNDVGHEYAHAARSRCYKIVEISCNVCHRSVTHGNRGIFQYGDLAREDSLLNRVAARISSFSEMESLIVRNYTLDGGKPKANH